MQDLLAFLDNSPTAWHAVDSVKNILLKKGFKELWEEQPWTLKRGQGYFVKRNGSIAGFSIPKENINAIHIAGGHTDSPGFKLKPQPEFRRDNMIMWGLEVYGAPLITSWLNRDLVLAGRIITQNKKNSFVESLIYLPEVVCVLPQLAIHLDRKVNDEGLLLNKQTQLSALAAIDTSLKPNQTYLETILKNAVPHDKLLSFDLMLVPKEKAHLIGANGELFASARIDNLGSVYAILTAFINAQNPQEDVIPMFAFWDHEEIGSETGSGAGSTFIPSTIERILLALNLSREEYLRMLPHSFCLSVDVAHAYHPNYPERHEPLHHVLFNHGVVLKINAQQRYASDARSGAFIEALCKSENLSLQKFVTRGDILCGTTIGPIHSALTGMPTVDIGYPVLSMHSVRELGGISDHLVMEKLLTAFYRQPSVKPFR